jgi:starvation-inducible DNA-binding protein
LNGWCGNLSRSGHADVRCGRYKLRSPGSASAAFTDWMCLFTENRWDAGRNICIFKRSKKGNLVINHLKACMMKTNIGITEEHRAAVSAQLAKLLADEFVLYTKTRNAHWNIEGPDFHAMHLFFESQYQQLDLLMDSVAERIRQLGHYAPATLTQFLQLTHLTEASTNHNDSAGFLKELLQDHESIITFIRGNINPFANEYHDAGTSDFITGLMEKHEEMAWMLRSHFA